MRRTSMLVLAFVATLIVGSVAVGTSLAMLMPAGRELAYGTTYYECNVPEFSALSERSVVLDRDGGTLAVLFAEEDRAPIPLDQMPDFFVDAVLAIEDRQFFEHNGVDMKGTARALVRNLQSGEVVEGGSTITQQLVDIALVEGSGRSLDDKIKETALALCVEDELSKEEILERYLNEVYFGSGAYGLRAAAERYFDKDPTDIDVHEAALLAGLIQNPEGANPINFPERARARRLDVLEAMRETGLLNDDEVLFASATPLPETVHAFSDSRPAPNNFFVEEVKRRLLRDERLGATYQDRYDAVFRSGLRIHTTFDPRLQLLAEAAVRGTIPEGPFTGALVALDNKTGEVLALFGGENFDEDQFNLATQSIRQTGSSFKPITLATALDAGYSPEDIVDASSPCRFEIPGSEPWEINAPGGGAMTLRSATVSSINCAYARLAFSVRPERIVAMADRLGIDTSQMQPFPSITLGTQGTPMMDMAAAYSVFASDGIYHEPVFVTRVETSDGTLLFEESFHGEQVLDVNVARTMTDVLQGVIAQGTGTRARLDGNRPAFGKTGTTDDLVDALFVGGTRQITTAVWMGNPERLEPMTNVGQFGRVFGGTYPALVWKAFMDPAHEGLAFEAFPEPDPDLWPSPASATENGRVLRRLGVAGGTGSIDGEQAIDGEAGADGSGTSSSTPGVIRIPLSTTPSPTSDGTSPNTEDTAPSPTDDTTPPSSQSTAPPTSGQLTTTTGGGGGPPGKNK